MENENVTMSGSTGSLNATAEECVKYSTSKLVVLTIVFVAIATTTIGGNILVIVSFVTDKAIRSFGNFFIFNLAIADLIIGFLMCIYTPYFLTGCWKLTRGGCTAFNVIDYIVPLASGWNMAVISLDRYWSVARPIEYRLKQNTRIAVGLMSVPWLIGLLLYGPTVIFWEYWTGRSNIPDGQCFVEFYDNELFLLCASIIEFIIPFVTLTVINTLIYLNIRKRSRSTLIVVGAGGGTDVTKAKEALARDKKSARSLAILVGAFFVTWAPYEICALVNPICGFCIPGLIFDIVFWTVWANSLINPILYPFIQRRFQVAFKRILCCGRVRIHPADGPKSGRGD